MKTPGKTLAQKVKGLEQSNIFSVRSDEMPTWCPGCGYFGIMAGGAITTLPIALTAASSTALMKPVNRLATTINKDTDSATAAILKNTIFLLCRYRSHRKSLSISFVVQFCP